MEPTRRQRQIQGADSMKGQFLFTFQNLSSDSKYCWTHREDHHSTACDPTQPIKRSPNLPSVDFFGSLDEHDGNQLNTPNLSCKQILVEVAHIQHQLYDFQQWTGIRDTFQWVLINATQAAHRLGYLDANITGTALNTYIERLIAITAESNLQASNFYKNFIRMGQWCTKHAIECLLDNMWNHGLCRDLTKTTQDQYLVLLRMDDLRQDRINGGDLPVDPSAPVNLWKEYKEAMERNFRTFNVAMSRIKSRLYSEVDMASLFPADLPWQHYRDMSFEMQITTESLQDSSLLIPTVICPNVATHLTIMDNLVTTFQAQRGQGAQGGPPQ